MFHTSRLPWKGGTATWVPQPADGGDAGIEDPGKDLLSGPEDWPGVEWPTQPIGENTAQTGSGNWGTFTMGTGGVCATGLPGTYTPPYGYYCSSNPPRGKIFQHRPPIGLKPGSELPNAP